MRIIVGGGGSRWHLSWATESRQPDFAEILIADTLNAYYSGLRLTTFREGDYQIPVYFRLNSDERASIDGLRTAYVEGEQGKIPLEAIATIESRWEPAKIEVCQ